MATHTSPAPETQPSGKIYGFFKTLPRELRDIIYDLLFRVVILGGQRCPGLLMCAPLLGLRLVNRPFNSEYLERFLQNDRLSNVTIKDYGYYRRLGFIRLKSPNLITFMTNMTLHLSACTNHHLNSEPTCRSAEILGQHRKDIEKFVMQMSHIRVIRIYLSIPYDSCLYDTLLSLSSITGIPEVIEIRLRPYVGHLYNPQQGDDFPFPPWTREMPTLATWTRQHGIVQDEEALNYCLRKRLLWSM